MVFVETHDRCSVLPSLALERAVNTLLGADTYYAKVDTTLPERQRRSWERRPEDGAE